MQACSLSATNLACRRGERVLFRGVNLQLTAGGALQITGSNGIGKTSLMRILAGLLRPFTGSVDRAGDVGMVDERSALDPQLTLGNALAFWASLDRAETTQSGIEKLGLEDLLDVPFRYLSTGQKKRAAFARLLHQHAPIWLLDEPLNGLDNEAKVSAETLIADHCSAGGICVIASHQQIILPAPETLALTEYAV